MSSRELVLYHDVTPGEPEGNGRSCLIGTRETTLEELDVLFVCVMAGPRD